MSKQDKGQQNTNLNIGGVICSSRERNPRFKVEVFKKKVQECIDVGYTKELAEWWVLEDFNDRILPDKRKTDIEGYYI